MRNASPDDPNLHKELTLYDSIAIVTGTIIGSGIFLLPQTIASDVKPLANVVLIWTVGGLLSLGGALSLAELGTRIPRGGGLCTYLHEAYGPLIASVYGWALLLIIHSGSIGALLMAFVRYAGQLWGLDNAGQRTTIILCVGFFTAINCVGIRSAKYLQNVAFLAKCSGLGFMIVAMLVKGKRTVVWFSDPSVGVKWSFLHAMSALVAVMWAYEGWHTLSFVTGEMKTSARDLPRALFAGVGLVFMIYVVATVGYYHVLSPSEIRSSPVVATEALGRVLGLTSGRFLSILILLSVCGSINGLIMTGPRAYAAMARQSLLPRSLGRINPRLGTPVVALLVQAFWVMVLALSGSYQQLFTDVIFASWMFYALGAAAVGIMRHRSIGKATAFRVPGYPIVLVSFCTGATIVVLSSFLAQPVRSLIGLAILATGLPMYHLQHRRSAESCSRSV